MKLEVAVYRILGIRDAQDPLRLLGISEWDGNPAAIDAALRRRVGQILSHPMRQSKEAEMVKEEIKKVAKSLRASCVTKSTTSTPEKPTIHPLTPLDRSIIAVLVSEGGWNRQSRSRLVGVAAAYGLTVGGLLRILSALAEASRSGTGPLSAESRIVTPIDRTWTTLPTAPKNQSLLDDLMDEVAIKLMPEFKEQTPASIIKLSVLFAILTTIAIILGLLVLNASQEHKTKTPNTSANLIQSSPIISKDEESLLYERLAFQIDQYPTFEEDIFTQEIGENVDRAVLIPRLLSEFASAIASAGARGEVVDKDILSSWDESISVASQVWLYLDQGLQEDIGNAMIEVILRSQQIPQLSQSLIASFSPRSIEVSQVSTIVRLPWILRELSRVACNTELIQSVKLAAKKLYISSYKSCDLLETRRRAIEEVAETLLSDTELDEHILVNWESWLAMVAREEDVEAELLRLDVISDILYGSVDLTRESNTRKVLGRMINEIDWARSTATKDALLGFYLDESIGSAKLWVFTSLLAQTGSIPWLLPSQIVTSDADISSRQAIVDSLSSVWPSTKQKPVSVNLILPAGFDTVLVEQWIAFYHEGKTTQWSGAKRFSWARRLNEIAAAIWLGRPDRAWLLIDNLDQSREFAPSQTEIQSGRSNGAFATTYRRVFNDPQTSMESLNFLRSKHFANLDPKDAAALARCSLLNRDARIRDEAVALIIDQFSESREVAIALVNIISSSSPKKQVESLLAFLTDVILPLGYDANRSITVRRAFVQHALIAGNLDLREIDKVTNTAAASAIGEAMLVNPKLLPASNESTIADAYLQLVDAWRGRLKITSDAKSLIDIGSGEGLLQLHLQRQAIYLQRISQLKARWTGGTIETNQMQISNESLINAATRLDQIAKMEWNASSIWESMLTAALNEYNQQDEKQ